jgi:hypothetical protein
VAARTRQIAHRTREIEAVRLSAEARVIADTTDWLTFRGGTLEDVALVRELVGTGEVEVALREAWRLYGVVRD